MSSNSETESPGQAAPPAGGAPALPEERLRSVSLGLVILGVVGFTLALGVGAASRAWQAFLVNLLFWLGIAQGGVVVSAAFYLTQGRWAGTVHYRLAEAFAGFLPLGFLLFWFLYFGRELIFPWVLHPLPDKADWLNVPFLFARDGAALFVMTALSLWFIRVSRRPDVQRWAVESDTIDMPPPAIRRLAPAVALCYAAVYTLLAFDLVMSLSPLWHSTLFGWYFFAGAFWSAIVMMAFSAVMLRRALGGRGIFGRDRFFHDLGKMVFAFSVFWVYLMFAQYLVIWYADIPLETYYVVPRVSHLPWAIPSWTALVLVWAVPFCVLLGKKPKQTPAILGTVAALGLVGMWLERYVLIVPSLSRYQVPFGWVEVLVTAGFSGAFALCALPGLKLVSEAGTAAAPAAGEAS